jgi:hypothetical protein
VDLTHVHLASEADHRLCWARRASEAERISAQFGIWVKSMWVCFVSPLFGVFIGNGKDTVRHRFTTHSVHKRY